MKRPSRKQGIYGLIVVFLLLGQVGLLVIALHQRQQIHTLDKDISQTSLALSIDASNTAFHERGVVDPQNSVVYFPELRLKLPLNQLTKTMAYSLRGESWNNAANPLPSDLETDVTSVKYVRPIGTLAEVDCGTFVRLKFEAKQNPYNPHETATTLNLKDGRILQIYKYSNEPACHEEFAVTGFDASTSPAFAAEFQKAESY